MTEFQGQRNVIILCDNRYVKSTITSLDGDNENLYLISNAQVDTAIYDLPSVPSGKRLSILDDFTLSNEKSTVAILVFVRLYFR